MRLGKNRMTERRGRPLPGGIMAGGRGHMPGTARRSGARSLLPLILFGLAQPMVDAADGGAQAGAVFPFRDGVADRAMPVHHFLYHMAS